jgi:hypothetical protein
MAEQQEQPSGWKRLKDFGKGAGVTVGVAGRMLNPLAEPVAQQAHLEPVMTDQAIVQQVEQREQTEWAHSELMRREKEAGRVERDVSKDQVQAEQAKQGRPQERKAHRERRPGG